MIIATATIAICHVGISFVRKIITGDPVGVAVAAAVGSVDGTGVGEEVA